MMVQGSQPIVSICIANFNGMAFIDACLRSVLAQDFSLPYEIIVHDDASTDGSADWIEACYPQVRLIRSENNVGFCVSNNRMVESSRGKYILLLNNDAQLFCDALSTLHEEACGFDDSAVLSLSQFATGNKCLIDKGCKLDLFLNPVPMSKSVTGDVGMVIGACFWVGRDLWDRIGGFPDWFGSIGEDLYFCCVARAMGFPVRVAKKSGYLHHVGMSFGGGKPVRGRLASTFRRRALSERNKTFTLVMTMPFPLILIVLPLHLGLCFLEGIFLSLVRLDIRYFREIYSPIFIELWMRRDKLRNGREKISANYKLPFSRYISVFDFVPYKLRMLLRHGLPKVI